MTTHTPGATDSSPLCSKCFPQGSWDSHPVRLCPLHASAPALLEALEELVRVGDETEQGRHDDDETIAATNASRHAVSAAKGGD